MKPKFFLFIFFVSTTANADQKSPLIRDEDISRAAVTVKIERPDSSTYRYLYTLNSPSASIGRIMSFALDVSCAEIPETGIHRERGAPGVPFNISRDGKHLPVSISITGDPKFDAGIDVKNSANAFVNISPNSSRVVSIVSNSKPGYRRYKLTPDFASHQSEHDYSGVDETGQDDPNIPSSWDFEIHGVIPGPACEGQAATPMTRPIFDGQQMLDEGRENNQLLRYEVKGNRNRWHTLATTTEVKFRMYYSYDIDPASFVATLNGNDVTSRFDPVNLRGAYEEVVLPLEGDRTRIEFHACKTDPAPNPETGSLPCDIDPFEIRRP